MRRKLSLLKLKSALCKLQPRNWGGANILILEARWGFSFTMLTYLSLHAQPKKMFSTTKLGLEIGQTIHRFLICENLSQSF